MNALNMHDRAGANYISLRRAGVQDIWTPYPPSYIDPQTIPTGTPIDKPDIVIAETQTIKPELINELAIHKPKMIIIDSPNRIPRPTTKEIITTIEEEHGYIIAGVTLKNGNYRYRQKTFTINTSQFNTPLNDENTYLVLYNKDLYMDFAKEIRKTHIPQTKGIPNTKKLSMYIEVPYRDPTFFLSQKEANKALHKKVHILDDSVLCSTPTTPQQMRKTGQYQLIEDDPWQVQGNVNKQGLRYPTPLEYARLQGYINYGFCDDKGNDLYRIQALPPQNLYEIFTTTISIQTTETIVKKYVQKLKEFDGRLS